MKTLAILFLALLSVPAYATPKTDFYAAYQACVAANPVGDARNTCVSAAWFAYQAALAAPSQAPAAPAKK